MILIRTSFGRHRDGEIVVVYFSRGDMSACQSAAHALAARLSIARVDYRVIRQLDGHGYSVTIDSAATKSLVVRETRAALRNARALWRARNQRAA